MWSSSTTSGPQPRAVARRFASAAAASAAGSTCHRSSSGVVTNVIAGPMSIPNPTRMPGGSIARTSSSSGVGSGRTRGSIGRTRSRAFFHGISGSKPWSAARTVSTSAPDHPSPSGGPSKTSIRRSPASRWIRPRPSWLVRFRLASRHARQPTETALTPPPPAALSPAYLPITRRSPRDAPPLAGRSPAPQPPLTSAIRRSRNARSASFAVSSRARRYASPASSSRPSRRSRSARAAWRYG